MDLSSRGRPLVVIGGAFAVFLTAVIITTTTPRQAPAQERQPVREAGTVTARRYTFDPARIEVDRNTRLRLTITAEDIPHSFTIDAYRISKRVVPGQPVTVEFVTTIPGTFAFYCDLTQEDGCRNMRGELVVR